MRWQRWWAAIVEKKLFTRRDHGASMHTKCIFFLSVYDHMREGFLSYWNWLQWGNLGFLVGLSYHLTGVAALTKLLNISTYAWPVKMIENPAMCFIHSQMTSHGRVMSQTHYSTTVFLGHHNLINHAPLM